MERTIARVDDKAPPAAASPLPRDGGFTTLSLLAGAAAWAGLILSFFLVLAAFGAGGFTKPAGGLLIALGASGVLRSVYHLRTARALAALDERALGLVVTYVGMAFIQAGALSLLAVHWGVPLGFALAGAAVLVAWPLALGSLLVGRRRLLRAAAADLHAFQPEDRGLQGLGALMVVFGAVGLVASLAWIALVLSFTGRIHWLAWAAGLVPGLAFAASSVVHARLGRRTLAGISAADFTRLVYTFQRTCWLAVSLLILGVTTIEILRDARGGPLAWVGLVALSGVLIVWPLILARVLESLPSEFSAEGRQVVLSRDGGLSALGHVLIGIGALQVALMLLTATWPAAPAGLRRFVIAGAGWSWLPGLLAGAAAIWLGRRIWVGGGADPRVRLALGVYVALSVLWAVLQLASGLGHPAGGTGPVAVVLAGRAVVVSTIPACAAWLLLRRQIRAV